ncbi:transposase [Sulfurimonas sp.]|uniref:transposase n=1 Tax=Sulfurimonas sp. TaxID=2022749 RepID=UPI002AB14100|nr:transposase [Sulfurimonas sp.]
MARRPRIDLAGYHHIVNRGVNRTNIFATSQDKDMFLAILCKSCKLHDVITHDYCLMDNHYHLLIENSKENLSLFMRQINANYAIYFNKKYKRTGHLWQGRFKSWYILQDTYLYQTIKYIEYNPIKAKMSSEIGEYPYALGSTILSKMEIVPCAKNSVMLEQYSVKELADFLDKPLSEAEIEALEEEKSKKLNKNSTDVIQERSKKLENYFSVTMNKMQRNIAMKKAYLDGYSQTSIAKELGVTSSLVSFNIKNLKFDT